MAEDADRPSAEKDFRDGKHGNRVFWRKNDTQPKRTMGPLPSQEGWGKPRKDKIMSLIVKDFITGEVKMASLSTTQKNGRTLLFPQMIDITDVENVNEIYRLIMEFEINSLRKSGKK